MGICCLVSTRCWKPEHNNKNERWRAIVLLSRMRFFRKTSYICSTGCYLGESTTTTTIILTKEWDSTTTTLWNLKNAKFHKYNIQKLFLFSWLALFRVIGFIQIPSRGILGSMTFLVNLENMKITVSRTWASQIFKGAIWRKIILPPFCDTPPSTLMQGRESAFGGVIMFF